MTFTKKLIIIGAELAVLYFLMRLIAMKWVLPFMDYEGDVGGVGQVFFLGTFIASAILYTTLILLGSKNKLLFLSILTILLVGTITVSIAYLPSLLILFLIPIPLFLLHISIAKLSAKRKTKTGQR